MHDLSFTCAMGGQLDESLYQARRAGRYRREDRTTRITSACRCSCSETTSCHGGDWQTRFTLNGLAILAAADDAETLNEEMFRTAPEAPGYESSPFARSRRPPNATASGPRN